MIALGTYISCCCKWVDIRRMLLRDHMSEVIRVMMKVLDKYEDDMYLVCCCFGC